MTLALSGARILTPEGAVEGHALLIEAGRIQGIAPLGEIPAKARHLRLQGGWLAPGFVDLQVNGGGGVMLNNAPRLDSLRKMSEAHARIGATTILPTLITDAPEVVAAAISAVEAAISSGVPGIAGLHLEGPHLAPSRKGAHDPALIRPMDDEDLATLLEAARRLPLLKVTLATESATPEQIRALSGAGVLVSLGHTDASFADCRAAAEAGAACVTHLFNAQSQMGNREPGVVGAALALGTLSAGIIADGIHVHPVSLRNAIRAKTGPGRVFLVSDSMATAGSDIAAFTLNGREIRRSGDRLTLADGTLAGAHLELAQALCNVVEMAGLDVGEAVSMATRYPADLIGRSDLGRIAIGARADLVHLDEDLCLRRVWRDGLDLE
ncbi:N-acetylglucosamine-6-phosphate deacetylase [Ruegeria pomeroyi]|uniref:N-acetylglucosamine-6-phosphate deacetylase n=2 Tax=Ruegeria pomeroyi TaxID=89184 RepID=Q5LSC4_RUEPO|nr:N-acetylglucosamine-6-phosphate deacetylase [Ruegeria pomeroyi]AAV95123.1 N-acetylglucosamine-6-phosphate deacetylase [Ruegeria pomeroyi DSS-3]NVK99156.1 N-acetylglucosamine-6-phosphate deacetylase [Ruegeria pomeroyi]NVL00820.1 N-acetylglucosamine-6-phosphate deacetylase [Ruegeria pomeroyi]QWV08697.1 N-acetylglucosamine-6-phosphate deacetylase [Ruegeria pomeroyi]